MMMTDKSNENYPEPTLEKKIKDALSLSTSYGTLGIYGVVPYFYRSVGDVVNISLAIIISQNISWNQFYFRIKVTGRNQLIEHDSDVSSKSELKTLQSSTHQPNLHSLQHETVGNLQRGITNQTVDITVTASEELSHNNVTIYERQMWQLWSLRKLEIQGQYAYMSIVFLVCLTLAGLQCMGGLHGRHSRTAVMSMSNEMHFLTVKEVLFMKARYLPLLHRNNELKEVLVHDCGTDP